MAKLNEKFSRAIFPDWPPLVRDHKGLRVRTTVPMRNGWAEIPEGTTCTIVDGHGGLELKTDPCKCCGVSVYIAGVTRHKVKLLKE